MKKLPNGISNYEELISENRVYVDKTMYIEKLEELDDKRVMYLRPRKFGKTLFTSVLENYYDIKKEDKFEELFADTYIGKNPSKLKNTYHVLRFNFSGIATDTEESAMKGFREKTDISIESFTQKYGIDFYINPEQTAEGVLNSLFEAFRFQKSGEKIYVIIDEYDHFANELLSFSTEQFKTLVSKNGKVRKWYEILKQGTETVVDRIFITGVAPITLDSLTSGFNIAKDITQDERFNSMTGFTKEELIWLMESQGLNKEEQAKLLPIMKEYYDGYKFSMDVKEQIYNSNMCLYLLSSYVGLGKMPYNLVDMNIASDYSKIGKMMNLCKGENRKEMIEKTISGEGIVTEITGKFNPQMEFTSQDLASMLFYLGYLTIQGEEFGIPILKVPNKVMKEIYSDYFLDFINKETEVSISSNDYNEMLKEIATEGSIKKLVEILHTYLNNLSNRDFQKFDEKYVKLIFYAISMNLKIYLVKSELEVNRKYPDILLIPRDKEKDYCAVMVEFKYLKKEEAKKLKEKQKEAKAQIEEYSQFEEIKNIEKLHKYTIVSIVDELYVEEIK